MEIKGLSKENVLKISDIKEETNFFKNYRLESFKNVIYLNRHAWYKLLLRTLGCDTKNIRQTLNLKVWKNYKMWLFSMFAPGVLIVLGAVLYFTVFRNEYSSVFELGQLIGNDISNYYGNISIF